MFEHQPNNILGSASAEQLVQLFIAARDARDTAKREFEVGHDKREAQLKTIVDELSARMQGQGIDSLKTPFGTVYKSVSRHTTCGDWAALNKWIVDNNRPDFFQRRLTRDAVVSYIEDTGVTPPGVVITSEYEYKVRKL